MAEYEAHVNRDDEYLALKQAQVQFDRDAARNTANNLQTMVPDEIYTFHSNIDHTQFDYYLDALTKLGWEKEACR